MRRVNAAQIVMGIALTVLPGALAHAGTKTHGGGGLLCFKKGEPGSTLRFLDLAEAQERGVELRANSGSVAEQVEGALARLALIDATAAAESRSVHQEMMSQMLDVSADHPDVTLVPPPDANLSNLPPECFLVGVGLYDDSISRLYYDRIRVEGELDAQNQAAFQVHEAIYRAYRVRKFPIDRLQVAAWDGSIGVRILVGYLFSLKSDSPLAGLTPVPSDPNENNRKFGFEVAWRTAAERAPGARLSAEDQVKNLAYDACVDLNQNFVERAQRVLPNWGKGYAWAKDTLLRVEGRVEEVSGNRGCSFALRSIDQRFDFKRKSLQAPGRELNCRALIAEAKKDPEFLGIERVSMWESYSIWNLPFVSSRSSNCYVTYLRGVK